MPSGFDLADYDFELPNSRIAQMGAEPRDSSKLLVVRRGQLDFEHRIFKNVLEYLQAGDVMVINQTQVIPARSIVAARI
jgi:S-adenosylmethionine:tRNA ribosyltransferase-isomerase